MKRARLVLTTLLALSVVLADGAVPRPAAATAASARPSGLYAANFNGASVTEYPLSASGNATPIRTIRGPHTGIGNVRDVVVAASGEIYTVNLSGPGFINVFAPAARGDAAPIRRISGMRTLLSDPLALALDAQGYLYVANQTEGVGNASILVFGPGASGNVTPMRRITGAGDAVKLAVDARGELVVAVSGGFSQTMPNQILIYAPGADGAAKPIRRITGPSTALGAGSARGSFAVALLPGGMRVRAAVSGTGMPRVNVYANGADGDAAPQFSLLGPATQLGGTDALAIDSSSRAYVADAATGTIAVYGPNASGEARPIRVISGPHTGMSYPLGLVIGPQ